MKPSFLASIWAGYYAMLLTGINMGTFAMAVVFDLTWPTIISAIGIVAGFAMFASHIALAERNSKPPEDKP